MGALNIGTNTLTTQGSAASPVVTLGATTLSGNPTFAPTASNTLVLGALNDGGTARTINQSGSGILRLGSAATSLVDGTAVNVTSGTLQSNNATALGTLAAVNVSAGATFSAGASQTVGSLAGAGAANLGGNTLTVGNNSNNLSSTFSGVISNGALTKDGSGTFTVSGTSNTYAGPTTVSNGVLEVTGSTPAASAVSVNGSGAVLSGTGTVGGATTVNSGKIRPGDSTSSGTLTLSSSLTVNPFGTISQGLKAPVYNDLGFDSSTYTALSYLDAAKAAAPSNDPFQSAIINAWKTAASTSTNSFIQINGALTLNAGSTLELTDSGYASTTMKIGDVFNLLNWNGVRAGSSGATPTLSLPSAFASTLSAQGLSFDTSAYSTYGVVVVVPEPSRGILLLLGFVALFLRRRRK